MLMVLMLIIGLASAFMGSLVGLGGGLIFVPSLLFLSKVLDSFTWVTPQNVVAMSLLIMIFTGLSSTLTYLKNKRVDIHSGLIFLIGSIPGALVGVWLNNYVDIESFELYFGILMLLLASLFFVKDKLLKHAQNKDLSQKKFYVHRQFEINNETVVYSFSVVLGLIISFFVGLISGLFGIGGGSLMVTAMILFFSFPAHIAAPTSMFMIFVSSIFSTGAHVFAGHVIWEYAIMAVPGAWIGGVLGAKLNQRLNSNILEWILRLLMIIIGVRLIL
ncbi:sulfite exporter TauE/SafE family protein [Filobacillus milosensis]|uniref:Probable membrane transporter protein n=1 Tax=Filobacillus milosensis TaxID=94137 RepID=A0A4Y8IR62_9BACI|nr:sulfite exporter TauE/SafE family protein [Filobacillus milosensis]TFB24273.1 sulfite exporter TauE/SafE family protein [Filobacillus milosensis]